MGPNPLIQTLRNEKFEKYKKKLCKKEDILPDK